MRDLMKGAGLNAKAVAADCGWHESKSSRILNARTPASEEDIRRWCAACGAQEAETADLIAMSRAADRAYQHWRKLHRTGLRRMQEGLVPLYERTRVFKVYSSSVVPGMVQIEDYIAALMSSITRFQGTPDDVEDAVQARLARSRKVVESGDHRFILIVEEEVLRHRVGSTAVMAAQLGYLLDIMRSPKVVLGVIPFTAARDRMWPLEAAYIFDDAEVQVDLLAAFVSITQPTEVAVYVAAFAELKEMAVFGGAARALIAAAIVALDS